MARTTGSKNVNAPAVLKNMNGDSEDVFLSEVLAGHIRWKAKVAEKIANNQDASKEKSYAEAYRVLLNKFSQIDQVVIDEED